MIWNLIALVVSGVGAAGIGLILRSLTRNKLPKWIVPVFAGIGMLSFQIHSEYTWFDHKRAQLPANTVVVAKQENKAVWRPWSYLLPLTVGFTVLDTDQIQTTSVADDTIAEFILYRFDRQHTDSVNARPHLLNCSNGELLQLDDKRQPDLSSVRKLELQDTLRQKVCPSPNA